MDIETEARRYTEEPAQLVDLCREVVRQLSGGENAAMETQLRVIARTVADLERQGVPVPDVLRAEKIRLAAAMDATPDNKEALEFLVKGLETVAKEIKSLLWRKRPIGERASRTVTSAEKTPVKTLRRLILEELEACGGQATPANLLNAIGERMQGQFLPGDLELVRLGGRHSATTPAWQRRAHDERKRMVQDGLLRNDSPPGVWELP